MIHQLALFIHLIIHTVFQLKKTKNADRSGLLQFDEKILIQKKVQDSVVRIFNQLIITLL